MFAATGTFEPLYHESVVPMNGNIHGKRTVRRWRLVALAAATVVLLSGCYGAPLSTREKGTLLGGALGLGGGALVGSAVGAPGAGAAIGGLLGAGSGFLIGNQMQNNQYRRGYY